MNDAILVTGGAGYIGSHVCKLLAKEGFVPVCYDDLSTGHAYAVKWGPFIQGELSDRKKLEETFRQFQPKAVLHFAASALVIESVENPAKYYRNNVVSSLTLLEVMKDFGVKNLIFSSTCATYGQPQLTPLTENHPQNPINPYGKSKWMVEEMIRDFCSSYQMHAGILRYFNVAGADLEQEIGENHDPETHLIPSVIQVALGQKEEIVVYGTDFPSHDGSAVRDYIHVLDLANAHILSLKELMQSQESFVLNLGTGKGYSVLEIIQAAEIFTDRSIQVRIEKRRPGEPSHLVADGSLAQEKLGWVPKYSDLNTIIESAWKWHQLLLDKGSIVKDALSQLGLR